ncbi:hypothetical protein [Scytonema sp. PCC 10023]|uniref:hypothetical protein n=1 Tax=Scytonema sp. PCC 10023 TaxID=1680591 RepID=UPI0039C6DF6C
MAKLTETVTFRLTEDEKRDWMQWCESQHRSQNEEFRFYLTLIRRKLANIAKEMSD